MTAPIPKNEANVLITRVNVLRQQCPYNEIELAQCAKEARRLLNIPEFYEDSASILGMLASITDDIDNVTKWHELAITASGGGAYYYQHYSVSLFRLFEYERALFAAEKAFELTGEKDCLDLMIKSAEALGDHKSVEGYVNEWSRRYGEEYPEIEILGNEGFVDEILGHLSGQIESGEGFLTENDFDLAAMRELVAEVRGEK